MSQGSVCQSDNEFKPCKQEQGGGMVAKEIEQPEIGLNWKLETFFEIESDKISKLSLSSKQQMERKIEEWNKAINSKNKEIEKLKAIVKQLEAENIPLETRSQERKLSNLTKEVAELREAKGELEAKIKLLEDQIKKLKAEKDNMQKELAELEGNNLVLEKKVDRLEKENKERVDRLEKENKERVDRLEKENKERVDRLEGQNKNLTEELAELEGDNLVFEEKVYRLEKENKERVDRLEKENKERVDRLEKENKERVDRLEGQNKNLKENVGDLTKEIVVLKHELHMANRPLFVLGELSFQIPSLMYQRVIPQWHNKSGSYSVEDIAKDITGLGDEVDEKSKIVAENIWVELKKELNWKEKYVRSLKLVRYSRNTAAHPDIDEELLYNAAEEARKSNDLNSDTYNNIKELIGIWKKLKNIK